MTLPPDSHSVLHKDKALLRKIWKRPDLPNALTNKGIFLGQFMEFVRVGGNSGDGGLPGGRIRPQN